MFMNPYVKLAKKSIETYLKTGKIMDVPDDLPKETYERKAGVFVTLWKRENGQRKLRGCIGTYLPTRPNIAQEIIKNSLSAALKDPRFVPLTKDELNPISIEVSILSPPQRIKSLDELDPEKYGIIVSTSDGRKGLLLPDIEDVDEVEKQISIAAQKGGIDPARDELIIYKFTVEKYE